MSLTNVYATYTAFLAYLPNSGNVSTVMAEQSIEGSSRMIDNVSGREFYPSVRTKIYDTPKRTNQLNIHDDLLDLTTLTNGDLTVITSSDYQLWPYNATPKAMIVLNPLSTVFFNQSATTWNAGAISVYGTFGYHSNYGAAWLSGGVLGAAIASTSTTTVTITITPFQAGQIIKIDSELLLVTAVGVTTITATRGWNGSTAATHLIAAPVSIWMPEPPIVRACLMQAARYYRRAEAVFGTIGGGDMGSQPVTLTQLDPDVKEIIKQYQDRF